MIDKGFESLEFYQDSLKLLKATYRLANDLPNHERYNLSDQMRRASCSILLNIAESYGRYHYLERLRFLYIARGSLSETLSAFIIAESLGYCTTEQLDWVRSLKEKIEKNLNGYCRFIKSQQQGKNE
ncbi:MAG: four helix bundle protein [Cyanobacteria bacterium J06623_7]